MLWRTLTIRDPEPSLCLNCSWAHIERGYNGEESIYCNFSHGLRLLPFAVRECTDYCDKREQDAPAVGFLPESDAVLSPALALDQDD